MKDMDVVLNGVIDLHIHAGPSLADRKVDAAEMTYLAMKYGYRAFVVKDHYFPTTMSAKLCTDHISDGSVQVFGGLCLNNSVGGFNLKAVDSAYGMGAKFIYLPTVSALRHVEAHKGQFFPGAGQSSIEEAPIYYLDGHKALKPEVKDLLRYMARHPDMILATGHGTVEEIDVLVEEAFRAGVEKLYLNHPFYMVDADMDTICRWVRMGAFVEINACVFLFGEHPTPLTVAKEIFERCPLNRIVISSDLGQKNNSDPAAGLYDFIVKLQKTCGITDEQINAATRTNPAWLLGLDQS